MRIAVDARFLQAANEPDLRDFTKEVFVRLWSKHTEDEFILFIDSAYEYDCSVPENVSIVALTPKPTNFLLYKWWYDVGLALALKKYKADIFIATYGCAPLTSSVSQVLVVRDMSVLKQNTFTHNYHYSFCKKSISSYIKNAKAVVTLSNSSRDEISVRYNVEKARIQTVGSGIGPQYKVVEWDQKEFIKKQFSEGYEYFVFAWNAYSRASFLPVLKAFSIFKKWQKSNMKLLVIGAFDEIFEKEMEKLQSYKFKNEVFIKRAVSESERAAIVAASYAFIFLSTVEIFPLPILEAMTSGAPIITSQNSSTTEVAGDTALYTDPSNPLEIAEQMKKIYKDEQLRGKLVGEGIVKSKLHNWDNTSSLVYQVIQQIHSK